MVAYNNNNNNNNNNIYLYHANSTIQFSNAPYNLKKKKIATLNYNITSKKGFFKKVSLQITFQNLKIGGASKI